MHPVRRYPDDLRGATVRGTAVTAMVWADSECCLKLGMPVKPQDRAWRPGRAFCGPVFQIPPSSAAPPASHVSTVTSRAPS